MKISVAGDSHGISMVGILEDVPAGLKIDTSKIQFDLLKRRKHYGRGERSYFEEDNINIISGIWKGFTTGAPITVEIPNNADNTEKTPRYIPRPGHGDFSALNKYLLDDLNIYTERNSARWTCILTALGNIAKQFLNFLDINVIGFTNSIGKWNIEISLNTIDNLFDERENSILYCPDTMATLRMIEHTNRAFHAGETLGGSVKVVIKNLKAGIGGYSSFFEKLDTKITKYLINIPSCKGVLIGTDDFSLRGSKYNDAFIINKKKQLTRSSNNAGGIESGFSNGQDVLITAYFKPIPTLKTPLNSVNLKTFKPVKSPYIRSDVTVIPSIAIISENAVCIPIMDAICKNYGNDNIYEIKKRYNKT